MLFIIKKAAAPFLAPPGMFCILLIGSGCFLLFKARKKAGYFNLALGLLMWLFATVPASNILMSGLESGLKIPSDPKGDVIILLSGGTYADSADFTGIGAPAEESMIRLAGAARLYKKRGIPIIISGASVFKKTNSEASIIKRFLTDLGVPENRIILDDKSRDTRENAINSKAICDNYGFKSPLALTSAYHMKRSVLSFKKAGLEITPFPVNFKSCPDRTYIWTDYLPGGFGDASAALREYIGMLFYKIAY